MSTLITIIIILLLCYMLKKASRFLGMFAWKIEKAERDRARYKEELLGSLKNIEKELSPSVTNDTINTQAVIEDQKNISEKAKLQKSIEEELGI